MDRNICYQKIWSGCVAVRFQPSALWHSASLLLGLKRLNDLSDKSLFAGYMNASSACWPSFPSARFLADKKIKRLTLVQTEKARPLEDLSHVLLRWQEVGIEIFATASGDTGAPSKITVSKPSRFKASWYRALATVGLRRSSVGGFGSFIPETSAAG